VGADGMHSKVRDLAAIGFVGGSYAESFLLADVTLRGGVPSDEVILYFSPAGLVVVAPLPGGIHRVVATVDDAPESPTATDVQALLDARGPQQEPSTVESVLWGSRFRVHHRIAEHYKAGRILLGGDAAHVHSPAGGQGMNTGIQDATALAAALAGVLDGSKPAALAHYSLERRPIAERVISLADRLTQVATVSREARPFRNAALRLLSHVRPFRWKLTMQLAGLA
jgi:2-polyprenyl-6-methoxyphenol hydroxylase-like FAD-dependent oxidoreductase